MRNLALLLMVLLLSCKKDDKKPDPIPVTPDPVVNYYQVNASAKPAVYTQTASPLGAVDLRDSTFFSLVVNGVTVESSQERSYNTNVVLTDSVKTGDKILLSVRMRTYTQNAKETVFKLNKAWLMKLGVETVLSSAISVTVPVIYIDSIGRASQSWEFTAP